VVLPIIFGVLVLTGFVVYEARSDHKSFDVSLFRNRGFSVSITAVSLAFFALSGVTFSLPFYLQTLRGYSTLEAGLYFVPFAVGQLLAAPRSAAMVVRFGYRAVMTTGLLIVTGALFALARLELDTPPWALIVAFFAFGFGMGNVIAPASTVMQNVLPIARVGAGSAVQNTVRQVFGAFGVAVIGTVLATRYAAESAAALAPLPAGPRATASTSVQLTNLVLQHAEAAGAPAAVVDKVRAGAFDAFLSASHFANLISTAVILVAAVVVFFLLPYIAPPSKHPAATEAPRDAAAQEAEADAEASVVPSEADDGSTVDDSPVVRRGPAVPETS